MAWKKIVVSGSSAELSNIDVTNAVTASAFVGDGSKLTNIVAPGTISSSAQIASDISGAFGAPSASFNTRITTNATDITALETFSSSLDTIFATEEEVNTTTASLKTVLTTSDQTFSGSFSGSYFGDGSQLTDITVDQNATVANTFTNATTASVTHNFNSPNVTAVIYDDNNEQFIPATVKLVNDNQLDVYMDPAQTGRVIAIRGGHIVSGSIPYANLIAVPADIVSGSVQIAADITGSWTPMSASFSTRVTAQETFSSSLDNTFASEVELNASSSTLQTNLDNVSSSFSTTIDNLSSTLAISGSSGNDSVNLVNDALTFSGASNEIETTITDNTVTIGIVTNPTLTGDVTVTGNLNVTGDTIQAQVTNLNVEDRFILLNSGSTTGDSGIIFGGSDGSANTGSGIFWDSPANIFGFSQGIDAADTTATHTSKLGNIQVASSNPSTAPTFQGIGTVAINDSDEGIWIYS
jgi:hypothetical protein